MKPALMITKPTELNERGSVVLGQCEPYTGGWRLVVWKGKDGVVNLLSGTYEELRALQAEWASLSEDEVVARASDLARSSATPAGSTIVLPPFAFDDTEATQIIDHVLVRQAVEQLGQPEEAIYLETLQATAGVIVLKMLTKREEGAVRAFDFGKDLPENLRGVVLVLDAASAKAADVATVMGTVSLLVGRLGLAGRFVWVAAGGDFAETVERSGLNEVMRVFGSVEDALKQLH